MDKEKAHNCGTRFKSKILKEGSRTDDARRKFVGILRKKAKREELLRTSQRRRGEQERAGYATRHDLVRDGYAKVKERRARSLAGRAQAQGGAAQRQRVEEGEKEPRK